MVLTQAQKRAFDKWKINNKEKWLETCRKTSRTFYENHKEERKKQVIQRYKYNKECLRLRMILLD